MRAISLLLFSFLCGSISLSASSSASSNSPEANSSETKKPFSPHFWAEGDFLYWVPQVSGLDANFGSGSSFLTTSDGFATTFFKETDVDPSFNWSPGYRIALGGQFDKDDWEIGGVWTDFLGSGQKGEDHGKWRVRLMQVDLAALYNAHLSSVLLQPFIGLRGTSILQKLYSKVITDVEISGSGTSTDTRTFHDREQFYGLGPLFGLNTHYAIKYGISFYGNIAFSILYGNYHLHFHDSEILTPLPAPKRIDGKIKKDMQAFDWNVDLALGIQWEYVIRDACCITLKLGLENHQYFDQSRLGHTFGNLSFSGGVFSFEIAL